MAERETEDAGHVDDGAAQLGFRRPEHEHDDAPSALQERVVRGPMHGREPHGARHRRLARPYLLAEVDEGVVPAGAGELEHDEEADAAALAEGRPADDHRGGIGRFLRDLVVVAVLALAISVAMKTFLLRPYYIPSASMHETLVENDRVLVNLLVPEAVPLARGDIVVFTDPGGWLPARAPVQKTPTQALVDGFLEMVGLKPEDADNTLIKRVIGLPGDHVVCCNAYGQVTINDVAITEPYVELAGNTAASGIAFDVTVPSQSIWVMGDNRYNSQDSRYHQDLPSGGFVPMSSVVGRAFMINLPLDRFGMLGSYPEVFANVPNREPGQTP
ncbi:Signal peptidase I [Pseudoclavibacter triregionum]|nr:Signal peptidase I [Pseudoclavibacter triregionum]